MVGVFPLGSTGTLGQLLFISVAAFLFFSFSFSIPSFLTFPMRIQNLALVMSSSTPTTLPTSGTSEHRGSKTKRVHKKSRMGCQTCKHRRIKVSRTSIPSLAYNQEPLTNYFLFFVLLVWRREAYLRSLWETRWRMPLYSPIPYQALHFSSVVTANTCSSTKSWLIGPGTHA